MSDLLVNYNTNKTFYGRSTSVSEMLGKDRDGYAHSLFKNLFRIARHQKPEGVSAAVGKFLEDINPGLRSSELEFLCPLDMLLSRNLAASTGSQGGFLVGVELQPLEILLRPVSVLLRIGARYLTGLKSNVSIPRQLTEATPYQWLAETDTLTLADESFGQVSLTPRRLQGGTVLTRQLEYQTTPNISKHVCDSLGRGLFAAFDQAALQGTGGPQPVGIFNAPNLPNTVVFSATATLTQVTSFEQQLAAANVVNPIYFIGDPATRNKWRGIARTTNSSKTLWDDDSLQENVIGHLAYVSTSVPANSIVALDPTKVVFGVFGEANPVSLVIDPYSQKKNEKIEITASIQGDAALANVNAVCISSGSTTQ